eukprot:CAMPEP_0173268220 /NCGR_PEP_ID=MMETSP1142-20121109/30201_1 /TAXON_ID=483371 /ORGANISM="non described non described, Strain CCMP2298" /LENGTH=559 /DNA_ID=CAMNT_0014204429 /DNA_START=186 /DNA_END=1862 /DNA_ORIENTATION=-
MGPPKRGPKRTPYSEIKRRYDSFEYRWSKESKSYYMFNPWTGETIFDTNLEMLDRRMSMWAEPDSIPSMKAQNAVLYPEFYASRRWGRRRFPGWDSDVHIASVARGFLARMWMRRYYRARFHTKSDKFSGYYYFVDSLNPDLDTTWFKPRLAFPGDVLLLKEEDALDYMKGEKYSRQDFKLGPLFKVSGLNRADKVRSELTAFYVENPWKTQAIRSYEEIDLENTPIGAVVSWMDGEFAGELRMTPFTLVRTALANEGWAGVLRVMDEEADNFIVQLYGIHSFAKTDVPLDVSLLLDYSASGAMIHSFKIIKDEKRIYPVASEDICSGSTAQHIVPEGGRLEFIDTSGVPEQGELRQAAVEKFFEEKFSTFVRYLSVIPNETLTVFRKNDVVPEKITQPLPRSVDMVTAVLKCLCLIAQENESKEQLSMIVVQPVLFALEICQEEPLVTMYGLQLFYNLSYRCEGGQVTILAYLNVNTFYTRIRHHHSGDPEVMTQCRRLELALLPFGWRGHVEELLTREMMKERRAEGRIRVTDKEAEGKSQEAELHETEDYGENQDP